jgi:hypothetical protein
MMLIHEDSYYTYNQALHFVLPVNLDAKRLCYSVIVLEGTAASRHDTQVFWCGAIVVFVVRLQLSHEFDACIYSVRFEFEEVQAATDGIVARFAREVYEFRK